MPLAHQADDEVDVDAGEHGVHRDHRPDLDEGVEGHQDRAGEQVEGAEAQHPGLQERVDQQRAAAPSEDVEPVVAEPGHRRRLAVRPGGAASERPARRPSAPSSAPVASSTEPVTAYGTQAGGDAAEPRVEEGAQGEQVHGRDRDDATGPEGEGQVGAPAPAPRRPAPPHRWPARARSGPARPDRPGRGPRRSPPAGTTVEAASTSRSDVSLAWSAAPQRRAEQQREQRRAEGVDGDRGGVATQPQRGDGLEGPQHEPLEQGAQRSRPETTVAHLAARVVGAADQHPGGARDGGEGQRRGREQERGAMVAPPLPHRSVSSGTQHSSDRATQSTPVEWVHMTVMPPTTTPASGPRTETVAAGRSRTSGRRRARAARPTAGSRRSSRGRWARP